MTPVAILLVLFSSVMHAGWNLACKSKTPSAAFFVLSTLSSIVLLTPSYIYFIPRLGQVPAPIWVLLVATGFAQTIYYVSLGNAYRLNDISLSYPLVRSLPVLLVPLVCWLIGYGKPISGLSWVGMMIVVAGCILLPWVKLRGAVLKSNAWYPFLFIVLAALAVTSYSIIDSKGLELLRNGEQPFTILQAAWFFIAFENLAILCFLCLYLLFSPHEVFHLRTIFKQSLRYPLMAGPATTASYILILVSMQFVSNVSYVVAFRQIGILIAVLMGALILKERITRLKIAGIALIFTGLILTTLG